MNRFLNELVKAALGVIAAFGIGLIAIGVLFLIFPEAMRWGIMLVSIVAGIYLCSSALYGILKAKTP